MLLEILSVLFMIMLVLVFILVIFLCYVFIKLYLPMARKHKDQNNKKEN